ncbi:NADPH-dependent 2,4-dienoyl-CoA reductase, sulfur reductase [Duganella sp. CF402]|uniref:NAD(P)/FAD-dependent oxidoreductase n=1 Tax=unclassified Duganella TaxID=2636909 RepID=UPI0008B4AEA4|nr:MULTISPECIES: NAD(P)/FAD-dependent oxidoreductase [unclassified Duganella]RZT05370.1 sulfide dehydrogenase (flavocytochrome c) flavoprotein subunit [Duganella sp. BK701]SEN10268.1 NADPH-dependent 2,4-dienoyl-CoA reductase, sulfur reductase [Duganella sp. CF402]
MKRRQFLQATSASALLAGCATITGQAKPHVIVIGGGYGGATAARYVRMWSEHTIDVTLIEPNASFISCPLSNLVLGGSKQLGDLTMTMKAQHGIRIVRDTVTSINAEKRTLALAGGTTLSYDRLIVSPGVDFMWDQLPGMLKPGAQDSILHAWKAGAQTTALRAQLQAMPDGGTYAMTIPPAPYRCPPGPYERASQIAFYFSRHKPKSKVLILDANDDVVSKGPLFKKIWKERYAGIIEYRPSFRTADVDPANRTAISELGDKVQADVLNVIPPQRAGSIAVQTGLANANARWCGVDFLSFESTQAKNIHVLGDAIAVAPLMPKSAHMANQHAKVCAAAVVDLLNGRAPYAHPMLTNTCYSFVSDKDVIHVASVHAYDAEKKTLLVVSGSGGVSPGATALEGEYAMNWARNIWADTLG